MHPNEDIDSFENFSSAHEGFLRSLEEFPDEPLPGLKLRPYQNAGIKKFRDDVLAGQEKGQFILGTGGGKTTISKAIIAGTKGNTLYLGPSRASAEQGVKELRKRGLTKRYQVLDEDTPFSQFDPSAELTYGTAQMFTHGQRYKGLSKDQFDLVIFDEAHHFLGEEFSQLSKHFNAAQLFMTATPGNMRTHLRSLAPHQFFRYTSDDLINNEKFPHWRVFRHEVANEHLEDAVMVGDHMQLEGVETQILNLPHRFAICRDLFLESVAKGEKRIAFMPSVGSSRKFVDEIVAAYPLLKGKVVHVDGQTKNLREIKSAFERGEILGICCKDLWNESLDVPDIAAITLADPSCSERVIMQRIGRGARPAPGKEFLRIDDIVSCISNMTYGHDGSSKKRPLTVHGVLGLKNYNEGAPVNGPEATAIYRDVTKYETSEVSFTERHLSEDIAFIRNPELGAALFKEFGRVFGTSVVNLFVQPEVFYDRDEKITIENHEGETFEIDFEDAHRAALLFGSIGRIEEEIADSIEVHSKKTRKSVKQVLEKPEIPAILKRKLDFTATIFDRHAAPLRYMNKFKRILMQELWDKVLAEMKPIEWGAHKGVYAFDMNLQDFAIMVRKIVFGKMKDIMDPEYATDVGLNDLYSELWKILNANMSCSIDGGHLIDKTKENDKDEHINSLRIYTKEPMDNDFDDEETRSGVEKCRFLENLYNVFPDEGNYYRTGSISKCFNKIIEDILNAGMESTNGFDLGMEIYESDFAGVRNVDHGKVMRDFVERADSMFGIKINMECKQSDKGETFYVLKFKFDDEALRKNSEAYQKSFVILGLRFEDPAVNKTWMGILKELPVETKILEKSNYSEIDEDFGGIFIPLKGDKQDLEVNIKKIADNLILMGIEFIYEIKDGKLIVEVMSAKNMKGISRTGYTPPEYIKEQKEDDGKKYIIGKLPEILELKRQFVSGVGRWIIEYTLDDNHREELKGENGMNEYCDLMMRWHEHLLKPQLLIGDKFFIEDVALDAKNPRKLKKLSKEELMKVYARIIKETGSSSAGHRLNFKKVANGFEFEFVPPEAEALKVWGREKKKYDLFFSITLQDQKADSLWKKIRTASNLEFVGDNMWYDQFDEMAKDSDSNSTGQLSLEVNAENAEILKTIKTGLAKYGVKFTFDPDKVRDPKYYDIMLDTSKMIV